MKARQATIKAKLPLKLHEMKGGAHCYNKQKDSTFKIMDKLSEKEIVSCVVTSTKNGNTFYADLWISSIKESKIPKKANYSYTVDSCYDNKPPRVFTSNSLSGKGSASGYGYDKVSAAISDAIDSCGVELYGTPYIGQVPDFKKRARIGGTGCHESALLAIAYACGYNNIIMVRA